MSLNLTLGNVSKNDITKALMCLKYDDPEYYYLLSICNSYGFTLRNGYVTKLTCNSHNTNTQQNLNSIKLKANTVIAVAKTKVGDYNKIKYVHDWLCNNMYYTINDAGINGFLLNAGQCMTYAQMFQYIMNELNIDCIYAVSTSGNHAWNRVKVNGRWYMIDVCWDDSYSTNNYFLKGKGTEAHSLDYGSYYPSLSNSNYR